MRLSHIPNDPSKHIFYVLFIVNAAELTYRVSPGPVQFLNMNVSGLVREQRSEIKKEEEMKSGRIVVWWNSRKRPDRQQYVNDLG